MKRIFPIHVLTHCTLHTDDSNHHYSNHLMPQLPWLQWAHFKCQSTHTRTLIIGCQLSYLSLETYYGSSVNIISLAPLYHHCLGSCWHCMNITAKLSSSSTTVALKLKKSVPVSTCLHICKVCKYECLHLCMCVQILFFVEKYGCGKWSLIQRSTHTSKEDRYVVSKNCLIKLMQLCHQ